MKPGWGLGWIYLRFVVVKPAFRRRESGRGRVRGSWFLVLGSWFLVGELDAVRGEMVNGYWRMKSANFGGRWWIEGFGVPAG